MKLNRECACSSACAIGHPRQPVPLWDGALRGFGAARQIEWFDRV